MGIFNKLKNLARSNLNALLSQLEDPKKIAHQNILDLKNSKKKAQKLLVSALAAAKLAQQQITKLRLQKDGLIKDAEALIKNEDEAKAKDLLREKQEIDQKEQSYDEEIKKEQTAIETINKGLLAIDEKIQSIKNSIAINASTQTIEKEDAFETFSRMEGKIDMQENELEALNELLLMDEKKDVTQNLPKTSFDKHSDPEAIEKELNTLKKKLRD